MQILVFGEPSNPALTRHLRYLVRSVLGRFTNYLDSVSLRWMSEGGSDRAAQFGCCVQVRFLTDQMAETTCWDRDLSEAARRSADQAAKLTVRYCEIPESR